MRTVEKIKKELEYLRNELVIATQEDDIIYKNLLPQMIGELEEELKTATTTE